MSEIIKEASCLGHLASCALLVVMQPVVKFDTDEFEQCEALKDDPDIAHQILR